MFLSYIQYTPISYKSELSLLFIIYQIYFKNSALKSYTNSAERQKTRQCYKHFKI